MANSIRLHPEHGVNSTLIVCNWCGKETGEIALLGASYKGKAPWSMPLNDEPCAQCKAQMAKGITFIERDPVNNERTGRWSVLKEKAVRDILNPGKFLESVLKQRAVNISPDMANQMGVFDYEVAGDDK